MTTHYAKHQKAKRDARIAKGLCVDCGKPNDGVHIRCADHHAKVIDASRRYFKARPGAFRASRLRSRYGITSAQYDVMLFLQGGGCAICGSKDSGVKDRTLHVDHDHSTGAVRGILCHHCNQILANAKDDVDILRKSILYLIQTAQGRKE